MEFLFVFMWAWKFCGHQKSSHKEEMVEKPCSTRQKNWGKKKEKKKEDEVVKKMLMGKGRG